MSWFSGLGVFLPGNVDLYATSWLLLCPIPGIWLASRFTVQLPQNALRLGLTGVLALSGVKLLDVPASSYVIAVGLGLGLIAFACLGVHASLGPPRPTPARRQ